MLRAVRGKKLRFAIEDDHDLYAREDPLTSCVFGLLRYLPWDRGLGAVLARAGLEKLPEPTGLDIQFWPLEEGTEPDVFIQVESSEGTRCILVEAKLYADFHKGQLASEWRWVTRKKGRPALVTVTRARRDKSEILAKIERGTESEGGRRGSYDIGVITWSEIANLVLEPTEHRAAPLHEQAVIEDLEWVFEHWGLRTAPFTGWDIESSETFPTSCDWYAAPSSSIAAP